MVDAYYYFCCPGAARFPHDNQFNSSVWMDKNVDPQDWSPIGEVYGTRRYYNGRNVDGYGGKLGTEIGSADEFANGLSIADYGRPYEFDPETFTGCPHAGGVVTLGGSATAIKPCLFRLTDHAKIELTVSGNNLSCDWLDTVPQTFVATLRQPTEALVWEGRFTLSEDLYIDVVVNVVDNYPISLYRAEVTLTPSLECSPNTEIVGGLLCGIEGEHITAYTVLNDVEIDGLCGCLELPFRHMFFHSIIRWYAEVQQWWDATGTLTLGGAAATLDDRVYTTSGQLVIAGHARIGFHYVTLGSLLIAGGSHAAYGYVTLGSLLIGGHATGGFHFTSDGELTISGNATTSDVRVVDAEGELVIGGSAVGVFVRVSLGFGQLTIDGEATADPTYTDSHEHEASGELVIGGSATADGYVPFEHGSEGHNFPANAGTDSTGIGWFNESNAKADDGSFATVSLLASECTNVLVLSNFGFAAPSSAAILGFEVNIKLYQMGPGNIGDASVYFRTAGFTSSSDRAMFASLPTSSSVWTYGGSTDVWGLGITGADVNNSDFELRIILCNGGSDFAFAFVDYATVKVWW